MTKIETRTAYIWLHEPCIIWTDFKEGVEINEKDIEENLNASLQLTKGEPHVVLLHIMGKDVIITHEAMRYGATEEMAIHRFATAMVTASISERMFGNFFMKFFRPKLQNKIFNNTEEALNWLRTFIV